MDLGPWAPLDRAALAHVLTGLPVWLVGGCAVDALVGRVTREHEDIDVLALRRDAAHVRRHLADWDMHLAKDGALHPWPTNAPLPDDVNGAWCRASGSGTWAFELVFDDAEGDEWVSRRDPTVRRPITELTATVVDGLAVLVPEQLLLYKSKQGRTKDDADLEALLAVMSTAQVSWLADRLPADHRWQGRLRSA